MSVFDHFAEVGKTVPMTFGAKPKIIEKELKLKEKNIRNLN